MLLGFSREGLLPFVKWDLPAMKEKCPWVFTRGSTPICFWDRPAIKQNCSLGFPERVYSHWFLRTASNQKNISCGFSYWYVSFKNSKNSLKQWSGFVFKTCCLKHSNKIYFILKMQGIIWVGNEWRKILMRICSCFVKDSVLIVSSAKVSGHMNKHG